MKPEHRHELKTNELAEWLNNLPQWAHENLTTIIYVSVVACLVLAYSFWYYYKKNTAEANKQFEFTRLIRQLPYERRQILQAQSQGVDMSYTLIQIADNLETAAQNTKDNLAAASALTKRGDVMRMELHSRPVTVSREDAVAQINRAKTAYSEAIEKAKSSPSLTAAAKFGLGLCEEEIGNFDQSQQIYQDTATNPAFECTTAAVQAKMRLDSISLYRQEVALKPPTKPTAPTPLPQTEPNLSDDSQDSADTNAE
jgi:hypothetical protein